MTTLAIATWHANPELLAEQIELYNASFNGEVVHAININADFSAKFWADAQKKGINLSKYGNVHFVEDPLRTYYAGVAHAFFYGVQFAMRKDIKFDYIYWHTSSDLLIKPNVNEYIKNFDIGFATSKGAALEYALDPRGFEHPHFPEDEPSNWLKAIMRDRYVVPALKAMGMERLYKARCEGAFFSRDVFFELMYPLVSNLSINDMYTPNNPYPMEEYMFAQCVEFFCRRHKVRRTQHVVVTSKSEKQAATIEEMDAVMARDDKFGIKRFSPNLAAPERLYARKMLGLAE